MDVGYAAAGVAVSKFVRRRGRVSDFGTEDQGFFAILFERMDGSRAFHFFDHAVEGRGVGPGFFDEIRLQGLERPRRISKDVEKLALMLAHPVSALAEEVFDFHVRSMIGYAHIFAITRMFATVKPELDRFVLHEFFAIPLLTERTMVYNGGFTLNPSLYEQ